jgi:hypothetical protein
MRIGLSILPFGLSADMARFYLQRVLALAASGRTFPGRMRGADYRHNLANDMMFEGLLENLRQPFSAHCGVELVPTYAFGRLYQRGELLHPHRDRPACAYSLTMTLGYSGDAPWPIFTSPHLDGSEATAWHIPPGKALAYPGCEVTHWREPLQMAWQAQMFFHYVDANGPHGHLRYDGRARLAHQCTGDCNGCALSR